MESDQQIKESKALQSQLYYLKNKFKTQTEYDKLLEELNTHYLRCQSYMEINQAKQILKKAMSSETYNMDAIMDSMD